MSTVIYSASPLQAMLSSLGTTLLLIGLGIVGIVSAFFRTSQSRGSRIALGFVSVFLILVGFGMGVISYRTLSAGAETVAARLNDKHIRHESCGDDGNTCTRYVLETFAGDVNYDLVVDSKAYDLAQQIPLECSRGDGNISPHRVHHADRGRGPGSLPIDPRASPRRAGLQVT